MADTTYIFAILGAAPSDPSNTTLSMADLDAVRGALGLTDADVEDEVIHEAQHAAAAEMRIISDFPAAASQTGGDLLHVINAVRLLTASYVARHMGARIPAEEVLEGVSRTKNFPIDWGFTSDRLEAEAYARLYAVPDYMTLVVGADVAKKDIPGPPLGSVNGLSREQLNSGTYHGYKVY